MERRNTVQKDMVLDAVKRLMNHPTAEEIYDLIHSEHPSVSKGTVYRNLGVLVDEDKLVKVGVADGPDHYDHTLVKHFHMCCRKCKRVVDINTRQFDINNLLSDNNHFIEDYDVVFKGVCENCIEV